MKNAQISHKVSPSSGMTSWSNFRQVDDARVWRQNWNIAHSIGPCQRHCCRTDPAPQSRANIVDWCLTSWRFFLWLEYGGVRAGMEGGGPSTARVFTTRSCRLAQIDQSVYIYTTTISPTPNPVIGRAHAARDCVRVCACVCCQCGCACARFIYRT